MNGAEALIATLAENGVEACFANPGTSEMHFVSALGRDTRIRPVLGLFEGVCSAAADGYARIAGKPAATLLHLGPGLANASANLHNALRARSPMVNVVGDHATWHRGLDAPLASDIAGLARPNSRWVKMAETADEAAALAAEALEATLTPPCGPATLILPADCAWTPARGPGPRIQKPIRRAPSEGHVQDVARALKAAKKPVLLAGGGAVAERGMKALARIQAAGVRCLTDTFTSLQARGAGRFAAGRMLYFGEMAMTDLEGCDLMVLAETKRPVAFFAYPDKPSILVPEGCDLWSLAEPQEDGTAALEALAEALGAPAQGLASALRSPGAPEGPLTPASIGDSLARHMPAGAIVCDEAITSSGPIGAATEGAQPHDWLMLLGGAIGQGLPLALGAAIAAPGRKVIALIGDGSAMYTNQALWSLAREGVDVTVVILANHSYRILNIELMRTGAGDPGDNGRRLLDLEGPRVDWTAMGSAMGVPSQRCETAADFDSAFARAMAEAGPRLIEAQIP